jgi:hypothetical protein
LAPTMQGRRIIMMKAVAISRSCMLALFSGEGLTSPSRQIKNLAKRHPRTFPHG